jgi:hypothetical protein
LDRSGSTKDYYYLILALFICGERSWILLSFLVLLIKSRD